VNRSVDGGKTTTMKIVEAVLNEKSKFEKMLDHYLAELKTHREFNASALDSESYRYLDLYWGEKGRHPYLFYFEDNLSGFSFVRDPGSTKSECSQMAEFYIIPERRLQGIGKKAAIAVFDLFPGNWEVQIHIKNVVAVKFWKKCIESKARYEPSVTQITAPDRKRLQYYFTV